MPISIANVKRIFLILLLGISAASWAIEPGHNDPGNYLSQLDLPSNKRFASFNTLLSSQVPSREAAIKIATDYWFKHHGLLAEEGIGVRGLYRIGRDIDGFASRDDWVWEMHVKHLGLALDGVILINAHTEKIQALGPGNNRSTQ